MLLTTVNGVLKTRISVLKEFIVMAKPTVRRVPLCSKGLYSASEKGRFPINGGEEEKNNIPDFKQILLSIFLPKC